MFGRDYYLLGLGVIPFQQVIRIGTNFDVLLTMHLSKILAIDQLNAQILVL